MKGITKTKTTPTTKKMSKTAAATKKKTRKVKKDRGIPFEEMRRLMVTYGSIKCLRKRQNKSASKDDCTKIDSVKRKFYRWFPDLDERFTQNINTGMYYPNAGHGAELQYRQMMRMKDGQNLSQKRAACRKQTRERTSTGTTSCGSSVLVTNGMKNKYIIVKPKLITPSSSTVSNTSSTNMTYAPPRQVSPVVAPRLLIPTPDSAFSSPPSSWTANNISISNSNNNEGDDVDDYFTALNFGNIPLPEISNDTITSNITSNIEPVDRSFIAERNIFDDVEQSFYAQSIMDDGCCATSQVSSSDSSSITNSLARSSSESSTSSSALAQSILWDNSNDEDDTDSSSIDDMLEKSIEECCEEIFLESDVNSIGLALSESSGCLFDMISSWKELRVSRMKKKLTIRGNPMMCFFLQVLLLSSLIVLYASANSREIM